MPCTGFTCRAFLLVGIRGHVAHVALVLARVSEVSITCMYSHIIQLSVEIIHSTLDKCCFMKSLAPFSLSSAVLCYERLRISNRKLLPQY